MADASVLPQLANAIPVLVGGVLAISGGIASQYLVITLPIHANRRKPAVSASNRLGKRFTHMISGLK